MALSVKQLVDLAKKLIPMNQPFLVTGKPGIGKSDGITQAVQSLGWDLVVSHPAVDEPTDYKGLTWMGNGEAKIFPIGQIKTLLNSTNPTVWFLDDVGQIPGATENALMQFIHPRSRRLGEHRIPDHVSIVAASNRREDNANVNGMSDPLKGRWTTIVEVDASVEEWTTWACKNEINPLVIAYLHYRPAHLCDFKADRSFEMSPTPRGWEHVSHLINMDIEDTHTQLECITGAIGKPVAEEFSGFLEVLKELPDLDAIERMGADVDKPANNNARYCVVGALAHRGKTDGTLRNVMDYVAKLPAEYRVLWSEIWAQVNPNMLHSKEWSKWVLQHKDELTI